MDYLSNNRIWKNLERIRFAASRPYECRSLIKKFYQCVDNKEYKQNMETKEAEEACSEYNYNECLIENSKSLYENRIFNYNVVKQTDEEDDE